MTQMVGQRIPLIDGIEKVTGSAKFTGDLSLPGLLCGKVLRSPYPHAKVLNIDFAKARDLPGVKAVVTAQDGDYPPYNATGVPGKKLVEDQYILPRKARFVGDAIAAVAAVNWETAEEALGLIEVAYEPLPFALDVPSALATDSVQIHEGTNNIAFTFTMAQGDVEQGFSAADYVFTDTFQTSKVFQCSIEPCGVSVAFFDNVGKLTVWTSTQMPFVIRGLLAKTLQLPMSRVRVIKVNVGGGFGSRLGATNELICALLARKANRPVKIEYSREESFLATEPRHPIEMHLKTGVNKDGTMVARQLKAYVDTGAYATHGPAITAIAGRWFAGAYKCPHIKYEGITVYTNTVPAGGFRGYGNPQVAFAVESQVDRITRELGLDPLDFRLKNHYCRGDVWGFTGYKVESCGLAACVNHVRQRFSSRWPTSCGDISPATEEAEFVRSSQKSSPALKKVGVGMAMAMHVSGGRPFLNELSSVIEKLNEDGTVNLCLGCADIGQGSSTTLLQIAADVLGIEIKDIRLSSETDTDRDPYDAGTHASRQIYSGGFAVKVASTELRGKILLMAAKMLDVPVERLAIRRGTVFDLAGDARSISVAEVARAAHMTGEGQIIATASVEPPGCPPVVGLQVAEVEVDDVTGSVRVVNLFGVHDVGKAVNPTIVEGQIEGSLLQGLGYALLEESIVDINNGKPFNISFLDYKLPTIMDLPKIEVAIVEVPSETGAFGVKSVGEGAIVPTAAAIANAVYDATGVRITKLPIKPEEVLQGLQASAENQVIFPRAGV